MKDLVTLNGKELIWYLQLIESVVSFEELTGEKPGVFNSAYLIYRLQTREYLLIEGGSGGGNDAIWIKLYDKNKQLIDEDIVI